MKCAEVFVYEVVSSTMNSVQAVVPPPLRQAGDLKEENMKRKTIINI